MDLNRTAERGTVLCERLRSHWKPRPLTRPVRDIDECAAPIDQVVLGSMVSKIGGHVDVRASSGGIKEGIA